MTDPNTSLLTQIKLAEMQRQRGLLVAQYAAIEREAAEAASPLERLRKLYDGLHRIQFAQKLVHPDVSNYDLLFFEADMERPSAALMQERIRQLEQELERGRRRAEYAFLFSRLLNEWQQEPETTADATPSADKPDWSFLWTEEPAAFRLDFLRDFFVRNEQHFAKWRESVQEFVDKEALAPVTSEEMIWLLGSVGGSIYRQPTLRKLALEIKNNTALVAEYASVVTILLQNLEEWDWSADGINLHSLWVRHRWRPYLNEDLVTLLFLQLIGLRWGMQFKSLAQTYVFSGNKFKEFQQHSSTASKTADEEENEDDFEADFEEDSEDEEEEEDAYYSVSGLRLNYRRELFLPQCPLSSYELESTDGYGDSEESAKSLDTPTPLEQLFGYLNADIRYHRAHTPDAPLFVAQTDLKDFFLRIPHPVLEALLEQLGVPETWRKFFGKYLRARVRVGDSAHECRQGVVLDHLLSMIFADCLLMILDLHVWQQSELILLRLTDDIYWVTDSAEQAVEAWDAVQDFCAACGLTVNREKSGSLNLNGDPLSELPQGILSWGLLQLQTDRTWRVEEAEFVRLQEVLRATAAAAPSTLSMIGQINAYLPFVHRSLGLGANLGENHLLRVGQQLGRFWGNLFGEGQGVVEEVLRRIQACSPDTLLASGAFPEALLYWPITAGGLGLSHPLLPVMAFHKKRQSLSVAEVPSAELKSQHTAYQWYSYYSTMATLFTMDDPESTTAMDNLIKDFVARSNEVGGGDIKDLSTYWKWIVATYGASVLEAFGTFRFLLTELVPLQLILQNRLETTSL